VLTSLDRPDVEKSRPVWLWSMAALEQLPSICMFVRLEAAQKFSVLRRQMVVVDVDQNKRDKKRYDQSTSTSLHSGLHGDVPDIRKFGTRRSHNGLSDEYDHIL
jgi:hypothetical protein